MKFDNKLKILLIILCIVAMVCTLEAQSKEKRTNPKPKPEYALDVTGGYFFHGKMFEYSTNNFAGLKTLQIGYSKTKKSQKYGISLGVGLHSSEDQASNVIFDETRKFLSLSYNHTFDILKRDKTRIFIGGFTGMLFDKGENQPIVTFAFPQSVTQYGIIIGPQIEVSQNISNKISIIAGSKLGLFEGAHRLSKVDDPKLPNGFNEKKEFKFTIAQRINFNVGLSVRL